MVCALSPTLALSTSNPNPNALWVAATRGVLKLATASGEILFEIKDARHVRVLAVDGHDGSLWTWGGRELRAFEADGRERLRTSTPAFALGPAQLAVDGVAGNVWLARGRQLDRYDADTATLQQTITLPRRIRSLALDRARHRLWVADRNSLRVLDRDGIELLEVDLGIRARLHASAFDAFLDELWVAVDDHLQRYDADGVLVFDIVDERARRAIHLAADGKGGLWAAGLRQLAHVDASGLVEFIFEPFQGRLTLPIIDLVADPTDGSVWVTSLITLKHFGHDSLLLHQVTPGRRLGRIRLIRRLDLFADAIAPTLAITAPTAGSFSNSNTPVIELSYQDTGSGIDTDSIAVTVDANPLAVNCTADETTAQCTPVTPFPEGLLTIGASVADHAGNVSNAAEVMFTVDTIAPQITVTSHTDGDFTNNPAPVLSGSISEAARVTINTAPIILGVDHSFSEIITLTEGANTVTIMATDGASNMTTVALTIILDTVPPDDPNTDAIDIGDPVNGEATVTGEAGSVEAGAEVTITNTRSGQSVTVTADANGAFMAEIAARAGDQFEIVVSDAAGNSSNPLPILTNTAPVLGAVGNRTAPVGQTTSFTLSATDADGDALLFGVTPLPANASFDALTGAFRFAPTSAQVGTVTLTFSVTDGRLSDAETITITVPAPDPNAQASFSGRLLDANDFAQGITTPIVGATVSFLDTGQSTLSDAQGNFTITGLPGGQQILDINTTGASPAPGGSTYAGFRERTTLALNVDNIADRPFFLPRIATNSLTTVDPNATTVVTNPTLGVNLTIAPNTAKDANGNDFTGQLSISEVPRGFAPAELPEFLDPGLLVTIQPVGVTFAQPVPITFPNFDDLTPGSETDIWSLDPDTGTFTVVGIGQVSSDGSSIVTISGGVRAADWHASLPAAGNGNGNVSGAGGPSSGPGGTGGNGGIAGVGGGGGGGGSTGAGGGDSGPGCNGRAGFGSDVTLRDGCLGTTLSLPPYVSLGQSRSLTFVYQSNRAFPQPVVPFEATIPVRAAVPPTLSHQIAIGGVEQGEETFIDTSGLSESIDETVRAATSVDARQLPTGVYPYRIRLTSNYARSRVSSFINDRVTVINGQASAFGAGWALAGVQRLYPQSDFSVLIVGGDGSASVHQPATTLGDGLSVMFFRSTNVASGFANVSPSSFTVRTAQESVSVDQYRIPVVNFPVTDFDRTAFYSVGPNGIVDAGSTALLPKGDDISFAPPGGNNQFGAQFSGFLLVPEGGDVEFTIGVDDRFDLIVNGQSVVRFLSRTSFRNFSGTATGLPAGPVPITLNYAETTGKANLVLSADGGGLPGGVIPQNFLFENEPTEIIEPRTFAAPAGDFSTLIKNDDATFTRTFKDGTEVRFSAEGLQTALVDRNGNVTNYGYDTLGRLITITDPVGLVTMLDYAGDDLFQVTDPAGRITTFDHDAAGNLIQVTLPDGSTRGFGYDARHLMTSETSGRGFTTEREYDANARVFRATLPDGSVRQAANVQTVGLVESEAGQGTNTNPAPVVRPADAVSTYTDGEGRTWTLEIGPLGTATSRTAPTGLTTQIERNDDANRTRIVLPNGAATATSYDGQSNPITVTDEVLGGTVQMSYEPVFNQLASITDSRGNTTTLTHDANGNPIEIASPLNRTTQLGFDNRGLVTSLTDVLGTPSTFTHDAVGNVTQVIQGSGPEQRLSLLSYTPEGYLASLTDPEGRVFGISYDPMGRVTRQTLPDGRIIDIGYDASGNVASITPPGRPPHTFAYSALDLESEYDPPAVGLPEDRTTFSYNLAQQLTRITRPDGQTVNLGYDSGGRLSSITIPRGLTGYSYNTTTGNLTTMTAPDGDTLTFGYNADLWTSTAWGGSVTGSVTRGYDTDRRITRLGVNGADISFGYDDDGLLIQAGTLALTRDAQSGFLSATTLGGVGTARSYNAFGELSSEIATDGANTIYDVTYTRDKLGRITQKVETVLGQTVTTSYTYDLAGRLTEVTENAATRSYAYDANGNRLSLTTPTGTLTGGYDDQDRLLSYGTNTYSYTPNGELLTKTAGGQTITYTYDVLGNLTQVTLPDGTSIEYVIDGQNRRIGKKVNGTFTQGFLYQDQLNPIAELDGSGNVIARFVYGSKVNVPDYLIKDAITYRIVSDHLGSPRLVINTTDGTVAQRMDYDEFGNVTLDTNPGFQPFGFAGGLYDIDTSLVRFGARDYDPEIGRWTAKDSIGFAGGDTNLYGYVLGDPVNLIDSLGMQVEPTDNVVFDPSMNCSCTRNCQRAGGGSTPICDILPIRDIRIGDVEIPLLETLCKEFEGGLSCARQCQAFCAGETPTTPFPDPESPTDLDPKSCM